MFWVNINKDTQYNHSNFADEQSEHPETKSACVNFHCDTRHDRSSLILDKSETNNAFTKMIIGKSCVQVKVEEFL